MFEHFSDRGRRVAVLAQEEARNLDDAWIGDEHLFYALAANSESEASQAFTAAGPTPAQIHEALASSHISNDELAPQNLPFNDAAKRALERARHQAFGEPGGMVTTAHILEATLATPSTRLAETLIQLSVNRSTLLAEGRRAHRADTESSSSL